jgi:hypothetical protein
MTSAHYDAIVACHCFGAMAEALGLEFPKAR